MMLCTKVIRHENIKRKLDEMMQWNWVEWIFTTEYIRKSVLYTLGWKVDNKSWEWKWKCLSNSLIMRRLLTYHYVHMRNFEVLGDLGWDGQ